jgi:hypothetical protein
MLSLKTPSARPCVDQEFNDLDCKERGRKRTSDAPDIYKIGFSSVQTRWGDTRTTVNGHSAATAAELNHSPKYTQSFALTGPLSSQNSKLGQAVHGAWDHPETARSGLIARWYLCSRNRIPRTVQISKLLTSISTWRKYSWPARACISKTPQALVRVTPGGILLNIG